MNITDLKPHLLFRQSNALNSRHAALRLVQIIMGKKIDVLGTLSANHDSLVDLWMEELEAEHAKSTEELGLLQSAIERLRSVKEATNAPIKTEEVHALARVA